MGVCASCLGSGRQDSADDPSETALLHSNPYDYGTSYHDPTGRQLDPEAVRRAQDALDKICAETLDKLIDVSQASQIDDQSSLSDYARLFGEAFPPSSGAKADDERVWIRNIIQHAAPNDRTWDWTSVQEIEGDLISSLDQDG